MKKLGIALLILCGIGILLFGRWHWNKQIASTVAGETTNAETIEAAEAIEAVEVEETTSTSHMSYTKNLPDDVVNKLEEAKQNNEAVNLTLIARSYPAWVDAFTEELMNTYGEGVWDIQTIIYGELTSAQLLESDVMQRVEDTDTDVILFEAPLLNDNGQLGSEASISFNSQILERWSTAISDVTIMVQPSNPIYQGVFYPQEVEQFQAYIEESGYTYIDYWRVWPDKDSEEMLTYLIEGSSTKLNETGYQLWGDYLINFFISR